MKSRLSLHHGHSSDAVEEETSSSKQFDWGKSSGGSTSACAPPQEISVRPLSVTRNFDDPFFCSSAPKSVTFYPSKQVMTFFLLIS